MHDPAGSSRAVRAGVCARRLRIRSAVCAATAYAANADAYAASVRDVEVGRMVLMLG